MFRMFTTVAALALATALVGCESDPEARTSLGALSGETVQAEKACSGSCGEACEDKEECCGACEDKGSCKPQSSAPAGEAAVVPAAMTSTTAAKAACAEACGDQCCGGANCGGDCPKGETCCGGENCGDDCCGGAGCPGNATAKAAGSCCASKG